MQSSRQLFQYPSSAQCSVECRRIYSVIIHTDGIDYMCRHRLFCYENVSICFVPYLGSPYILRLTKQKLSVRAFCSLVKFGPPKHNIPNVGPQSRNSADSRSMQARIISKAPFTVRSYFRLTRVVPAQNHCESNLFRKLDRQNTRISDLAQL